MTRPRSTWFPALSLNPCLSLRPCRSLPRPPRRAFAVGRFSPQLRCSRWPSGLPCGCALVPNHPSWTTPDSSPPPVATSTGRPFRRTENFWLLTGEEHTSELQSPCHLVCRLLLEKTK